MAKIPEHIKSLMEERPDLGEENKVGRAILTALGLSVEDRKRIMRLRPTHDRTEWLLARDLMTNYRQNSQVYDLQVLAGETKKNKLLSDLRESHPGISVLPAAFFVTPRRVSVMFAVDTDYLETLRAPYLVYDLWDPADPHTCVIVTENLSTFLEDVLEIPVEDVRDDAQQQ